MTCISLLGQNLIATLYVNFFLSLSVVKSSFSASECYSVLGYCIEHHSTINDTTANQ